MREDADTAIVILAAGLGTRMYSDKAKVLHEICGRPLLFYVLSTAQKIVSSDQIVVVVGCQAESVREKARCLGGFRFAYQPQQLGTGHAVACALESLPKNSRNVVILCGDVPFIKPDTIQALIDRKRRKQKDVVLLSVRMDNPTGYGRLVLDEGGDVTRIAEEKDASETEKEIDIVNAGIYCVERKFLSWALGQIKSDNAQNELYLTDIVDIAYRHQRTVSTETIQDTREVIGINSAVDLAEAEKVMQENSGYLS